MDSSSLQELEQIPGAGYTIARDIGRTGRISNTNCSRAAIINQVDKK